MLMEPIVVELKAHELDGVLEKRAEWEGAGFDAGAARPDALAVRSVPALLAAEDMAEMVQTVFAIWREDGARITSMAPPTSFSAPSPAAPPSTPIAD